jgi:predicted nucleic acid-binding protein
MTLQQIVFDASTLILLAKTDLLQIVASKMEIHIPSIVDREVQAKPHSYDAQMVARMIMEGVIRVSDKTPGAEVKTLQKQFRLAEGEASALWMAKAKKCVIGIDDGPGIRAAKVLGVPFVTAIHILIGLYEHGDVQQPSALAKLDSLATWGRYSMQLVSDARLRIFATQAAGGEQKGGD